MMQIYLLSIAYLLLGSGILLSDSYGGRYSLLLSLRYVFRTNRAFRKILVILGFLLSLALGFFPMAPGPPLLGDLVPMATTILLTLWYLLHAYRYKEGREGVKKESALLHSFEKNRKLFGFITALVAVLHFLVPMSVLL